MTRDQRQNPGTPGGTTERPALFFADAGEFRRWLELNHETETELWMGMYKKHAAERGITWAEAVPEALCFGWIDSVAQRLDEDSMRQRWTPRKAGSNWSKVNVEHVERLIAEGRMRPAGLAAYEKRRADRTGSYSFEQEGEGAFSPDLEAMLRAHPRASAFWSQATPGYRKVAVHWVMQAKQPTTRAKRMRELIAACAAGVLAKPFAYGEVPKWVARAAAAASSAAAAEAD